MSSKPSLIFLAGAWHSPEVFSPVISKLTPLGYECTALPLQAVIQKPAVKDLQPDIDALRSAVITLADAGKDVVVVSQSWSGIIVGGALHGLGKSTREKEGKKGGVVKIAYLCAFCPLEGVSLITAFGGQIPEFYDVKEPWVLPKDPVALFYHDLPASSASHWAAQLRPHSYATKFIGTTAPASWRSIPSSYLICEDDRAIPVQVQEAMVKACQDEGADMVTERLWSSHSPMLSKVEETVGFVRRAAGEEV